MTLRLVTDKSKEESDLSFAREVREKSKSHLERCYQCIACSSGCPVAYVMDYPPHQIIRMTQLGMKDQVLNSKAYWLCASCETCATRCPNEIDIVKFMDTLREIAISEGRTEQTPLPLFHNTFLGGIKSNGKIHEIGLILGYMIKSREIFNLKEMLAYIPLGLNMFLKGKIAILPDRIKGAAEVRRAFRPKGKESGAE
jgi:heterodisulfide reductase subunit C